MSELASHATDYSIVEEEPAHILSDNLSIAAKLWSSATFFFFFAFLFAYFYLRTLNQGHNWRPKGINASTTIGTLIAAALVVAGALLVLGVRDRRAMRLDPWRVKGAVALALILAAAVVQIVGWATQGFGPTDGGYASVYVGWTGFQLFFIVGLAFWLETTLATSLRYRGTTTPQAIPAGHASGDSHREAHDVADPLSLVQPQLEAVTFYAIVMAGLGVVSWIVLYLL